MKLNPDCIRDILLDVESIVTYDSMYRFVPGDPSDENSSNSNWILSKYTDDELLYHFRQCKEIGFFTDCKFDLCDNCIVADLSPMAHQFLADIRTETVWNKTKETAKNVGSFSLNALMQISTSVISNLINSQLGN